MKKLLLLAVLAAGLSGCANGYNRNDSTVADGLLGAGTGAIVGGVATGRAEGALVGAAIGGVGGALVGNSVGRDRRYNRRYNTRCTAYDNYGNRYATSCRNGMRR